MAAQPGPIRRARCPRISPGRDLGPGGARLQQSPAADPGDHYGSKQGQHRWNRRAVSAAPTTRRHDIVVRRDGGASSVGVSRGPRQYAQATGVCLPSISRSSGCIGWLSAFHSPRGVFAGRTEFTHARTNPSLAPRGHSDVKCAERRFAPRRTQMPPGAPRGSAAAGRRRTRHRARSAATPSGRLASGLLVGPREELQELRAAELPVETRAMRTNCRYRRTARAWAGTARNPQARHAWGLQLS